VTRERFSETFTTLTKKSGTLPVFFRRMAINVLWITAREPRYSEVNP